MKTISTLLLMFTLVGTGGGQVLPPHSSLFDKPIADWTVDWWLWSIPQTTNENPTFDPDGRWANTRQAGPVFFVAGAYVDVPVVVRRSYTVPENKYLLFPLLVADGQNIDVNPPLTPEDLRNLVASFFVPDPDLYFSIDSTPVPNLLAHRELAPVFSVNLTSADNLLSFYFRHSITGLVDPVVLDGYWIMVEPLSPGTHVFAFGGAYRFPGGPFFDRVDTVTVVPAPLEQKVEELETIVAASKLPLKHLRPLLASLNSARKSFEREHFRAGIDQLRAFQNKVRHQVTRIDHDLADQFIQAAQQIIAQASQELKHPNHN